MDQHTAQSRIPREPHGKVAAATAHISTTRSQAAVGRIGRPP